ncbi:MAG TPA: NAD(P)-binding protein, partial [Thermodesulfobacteriota bacterium]|nr:NAD(P)-binding protein [Thermodesulfobacteriota bacterium]
DITVVGAGPVGLYAAYYSGLRECRTKLIETYPQVGGRLISMYPEKEIFDVAGHRRIVAADLVRELTDQAMQYGPTVVLNERVTGLRILGERVIELTTPAGVHYTQTVILAAGCGALSPGSSTSRTWLTSRGTGSSTSSPRSNRSGGKRS